jgi:hypothetical protein
LKKGKWVWLGLVVVAVLVAGTYALNNFLVVQHGAEDACAEFLTVETGRPVSADQVTATLPEVHFASRFDKRFRSTCSFENYRVELESSLFGKWRVLRSQRLD